MSNEHQNNTENTEKNLNCTLTEDASSVEGLCQGVSSLKVSQASEVVSTEITTTPVEEQQTEILGTNEVKLWNPQSRRPTPYKSSIPSREEKGYVRPQVQASSVTVSVRNGASLREHLISEMANQGVTTFVDIKIKQNQTCIRFWTQVDAGDMRRHFKKTYKCWFSAVDFNGTSSDSIRVFTEDADFDDICAHFAKYGKIKLVTGILGDGFIFIQYYDNNSAKEAREKESHIAQWYNPNCVKKSTK